MPQKKETTRKSIASYLKPMLFPIVRFCLKRGIKLQEFLEIAKDAFIEAGKIELNESNVEVSTNRISIFTGVHRRDVERFKAGEPTKKTTADILTRVIGQWKNDKRFCSKNGLPNKLNFSGKEGEFAELVATVSRELSPYTVLSEMERLNYVEKSDNKITLKRNEFSPAKDAEVSLNMLGEDINDLVSAVERNTFEPDGIPSLHLTTRYDNLCEDSIKQINHWLILEGEKIHERARNYLSKFDKDLNPKLSQKKGGYKISLGTFGHIETTNKGTGK